MEAAMQAAVDELWTAYDTLWGSGGTFAVGTKIGAILIAVVAIFLTVAVAPRVISLHLGQNSRSVSFLFWFSQQPLSASF